MSIQDISNNNQVFLNDIEKARAAIRIDIPHPMAQNSTISELCDALKNAKQKGVDIYIRAENKAELPDELKVFAIENSAVKNPITIVDKKITWFGRPESNAGFAHPSVSAKVVSCPAIRIVGAHTATMIVGLLGMDDTTDRSTTVSANQNGEMIIQRFSDYVLSEQKCPVCGKPMQLKKNKRHTFFLGCSNYPSCTGSRLIDVEMVDKYIYRKKRQAQQCPVCKFSLEAKGGRRGVYTQCCGINKHIFSLDQI